MPADLHIHTAVSDGSDTPAEVVFQSLKLGLDAIAITDHDTIEGVAAAREAAKEKNIEVLPGVEISCHYKNIEIHVLGYFKKTDHPELISTLKEMKNFRLIRAQKIVNNLNMLGHDISWERVQELAGMGTVGRPHIADAMVEKNIVPNRETAFKEYIGQGCPAYVPRKKLTPIEAIKLIIRSGGVAVLAHPGLIPSDDILPELVYHGLRGIEVWHPHHSQLQTRYYLQEAERWRLIPTGGSDYHGAKHALCNRLGAVTVSLDSVNRIKELLK
ncbi:MAG: PHP domain-containing protein [Desulfotomaculum sp.]|nr:PHP domain-containing protein [Desulfotomaculum sp.]